MNWKIPKTIVVILLGIAITGCADMIPPPQAGQVLCIMGTATRSRAGETVPLLQGDRFAVGDHLNTAAESRIEVRLADSSRIFLGAESALAVDTIHDTPLVAGGRAEVTVAAGIFRTVAGHLTGGSDPGVTIHTPLATVGVRGTDVWGGVSDGTYGVALLEGVVVVSNNGGKIVLDKPGFGTNITSLNAAPTPPVAWNPERIKRALETVSFPAYMEEMEDP